MRVRKAGESANCLPPLSISLQTLLLITQMPTVLSFLIHLTTVPFTLSAGKRFTVISDCLPMSRVTLDSFAFLYHNATKPAAREGDPVLVSTDTDGVTTVEMNAPPVNLLTPDYLSHLNDWLRWLANDAQTRGIILTSAVPHQFCAGGDLNECVNPTLEKTHRFWGEVQRAWLVLNAHRKPIVSVITGTCPGGGCVMSMSCDYRVMVRDSSSLPSQTCTTTCATRSPPTSPRRLRTFKIGLNAPAFGICMPFVVSQMYRELLGLRQADAMLQRGLMVTADEAVRIGLVDTAVETKAAGMDAAHHYLRAVLATPSEARYRQKMQLRLPFIAPLATQAGRDEEIEEFFHAIDNESTQAMLTAYIAGLHERKNRTPPPHL